MSKNSPLNFGMIGAAGLTMAQRVQNAQNAPGGLAGNMNNMFMFGGGYAQQQQQQQMQAMQNAQNQAQVTASSSYQDPNNVSASGFNPNTGNTTPTYNNLNSLQNSSANTTVGNVATDIMAGVGGASTPQVQTGSFSPDASIAAEGIFGSEESRGIRPYKKPLINF